MDRHHHCILTQSAVCMWSGARAFLFPFMRAAGNPLRLAPLPFHFIFALLAKFPISISSTLFHFLSSWQFICFEFTGWLVFIYVTINNHFNNNVIVFDKSIIYIGAKGGCTKYVCWQIYTYLRVCVCVCVCVHACLLCIRIKCYYMAYLMIR